MVVVEYRRSWLGSDDRSVPINLLKVMMDRSHALWHSGKYSNFWASVPEGYNVHRDIFWYIWKGHFSMNRFFLNVISRPVASTYSSIKSHSVINVIHHTCAQRSWRWRSTSHSTFLLKHQLLSHPWSHRWWNKKSRALSLISYTISALLKRFRIKTTTSQDLTVEYGSNLDLNRVFWTVFWSTTGTKKEVDTVRRRGGLRELLCIFSMLSYSQETEFELVVVAIA